jgi:hypothetical protein
MVQKKGTQAYVEPVALEKLYQAFPDVGKQATISAAALILTRLRNETGITSTDLIDEMVEAMLKARRLTLSREIKGSFSTQEWVGLLDAFNGTLVRGMGIPAREMLYAEMEDAGDLDGSGTRHGYDSAELLGKLNRLTLAQAEYLLLELRIFWEEINGRENGLDEFLKEYTS